jgi:O-antigen biosynthesis protein WbqP
MLIIFIIGLFDTGSPLFIQKRLGKNQAEFSLIKFRSMKVGTTQTGTHLAKSSEITSLGKFLRGSKLDELPQLWNVLAGDMSIVGARPGLPIQAKLRHERSKRSVFDSKPGITGLGQISKIDMSTPRKLSAYDQLMNKNMSFCFYLNMILATVQGKGSGDRVKQ